MRKLSLLLGVVVGLTTVTNVTWGSSNNQLIVVNDIPSAKSDSVEQVFSDFNNRFIENKKEFQSETNNTDDKVAKEVYKMVFGSDCVSKAYFLDNTDSPIDKSADDLSSAFLQELDKIHNVPLRVYKNFNSSNDGFDKLDIVECKNFVKNYFQLLFDIRAEMMRTQNKEHWTLQKKFKTAIKNMIGVLTDALVNNNEGFNRKIANFSNEENKREFAARLVAQQIFANIKAGYQNCIKDEQLTTHLNYLVGERSVPASETGAKSGDNFINIDTLCKWLSIKKLDAKDEAPMFAFLPDKKNVIPPQYFENAFDDKDSEVNFVGMELLRCCLDGIVDKEDQLEDEKKDKKFISLVRSKFDLLDAKQKLLTVSARFVSLFDTVLEFNKNNTKLTKKYKGNEDITTGANNENEEQIGLPEINDQVVESFLYTTLAPVINEALWQYTDVDKLTYQEFSEVVEKIRNHLSILRSSLAKSLADYYDEDRFGPEIVAKYGRDVYLQVAKKRKNIDEFFASLISENDNTMARNFRSLLMQFDTNFQNDIREIQKDLVNPNSPIYADNPGKFKQLKLDYFNLVYDTAVYFVDLGLVDDNKEKSCAVGSRDTLLTVAEIMKETKQLTGVTAGGGTSASAENGFYGASSSAEEAIVNKENSKEKVFIANSYGAFECLMAGAETVLPKNINSAMIPGILRKTAVMFYNMTDENSTLYYKHKPKVIQQYHTTCFQDFCSQAEDAINLLGSNNAKLAKDIKDFKDYIFANKKLSKGCGKFIQNIDTSASNLRLSSSNITKVTKNCLAFFRDAFRQNVKNLNSVLIIFENILNGDKDIAKVLASYFSWDDSEEFTQRIQGFANFLGKNLAENTKAAELQDKGRDLLISQIYSDNESRKISSQKDKLLESDKKLYEFTKTQGNLELNLKKMEENNENLNDSVSQKPKKSVPDSQGKTKEDSEEEIRELKEQLMALQKKIELEQSKNEELRKDLKVMQEEREKNNEKIRKETEILTKEIENYNKGKKKDDPGVIPPPPPPPPFPKYVGPVGGNKPKVQSKGKQVNVSSKPVPSIAEQMKNVTLKKIVTEIKLEDPKNPGSKIKIFSSDRIRKADEWFARKEQLEADKKQNTKEYKIILNNLSALKNQGISPSINKKNFLQNALSMAIKNRRQALHMYDDPADEEDDWD